MEWLIVRRAKTKPTVPVLPSRCTVPLVNVWTRTNSATATATVRTAAMNGVAVSIQIFTIKFTFPLILSQKID
jgi:hypothetical protein